MRLLAHALPFFALVTLAGCAETNDGDHGPTEPDAAENLSSEEVLADAQSALDEPGFEMQPGLYTIGSNGNIYAKTRLEENGTYLDFSPEDVRVGGGTWKADGASFCFTPRGDDGEAREDRCWINGPASDDGSFTTTIEDGSESYLLTPVSE